MKPKPTTPKSSVEATTTVKVRIKDKEFTLTKEEAQSLAKSLVDAVGLPKREQKTADESLNEQFERLRKAQEEADKIRPPIERPFYPPRPYKPDTWTTGHGWGELPSLDTSKFPPGTLLRQS